jgi:hypothetical protein
LATCCTSRAPHTDLTLRALDADSRMHEVDPGERRMIATTDVAAEVEELVWTLTDERATPRQIRQLERLCSESAEARQTYVRCMQMHADLHCLLGGRRAAAPIAVEAPVGRELAVA